MGRTVLVLAVSAAILAAQSGAAAPAVAETRSCFPAGAFFNVHFAGHKEAGFWLRAHADTFHDVPAREAVVAFWSFGSQATRAPVLYAWSVDTGSRFHPGCRPLGAAKPPASENMRIGLHVKSGWSIGKRYECNRRGRVAVRTERIGTRTRTTVWYQRSRRLIAVVEIGPGGGWVRATKSCAERSY